MAGDKSDKAKAKSLSRIQRRLMEGSAAIEADRSKDPLYQHTVFCQTGLPYRDPGPEVRRWKRRQGDALLVVEAGQALHPDSGDFVDLGLPFGPKPRLILAHLNREALIRQSPEIEVEESLTAFATRILGYDPNGKEIRALKDQLARLAASLVRLGIARGDRAFQIDSKIVEAFDLWFPKNERQRVLWPSVIRLSPTYFETLRKHAVPLDERAIANLAHNAMALDLYAWLAQRLRRVEPGKAEFITWDAICEQFGWGYDRMRDFKRVFRRTLDAVLTQYRGARLDLNDRGMTLRASPPPVPGRVALIRRS